MNQGRRKFIFLRWLASSLVLITSSCQFPGFERSENACGPATLRVAETTYEIQTVKPKSNGDLNIPANEPDHAFWVEGTTINQVFGLSPTVNNLALQSSLKTGAAIEVSWENCNTATYHISTMQAGVPENSSLLDQSTTQITLFVRADNPSTSFVAIAELTEETISVGNTPDASTLQAEISVLDIAESQDKQTVEIEVSIVNYGSSFTLTTEDILLVSENVELKLSSSEPALPYEIKPAQTASFKMTFPHPTSHTATLQILGIAYEVTGY